MGWPLAASPGEVSENAASGYLKRKLTRRCTEATMQPHNRASSRGALALLNSHRKTPEHATPAPGGRWAIEPRAGPRRSPFSAFKFRPPAGSLGSAPSGLPAHCSVAAWPLRPVPGTPSLLRPASSGRKDRTILEPYLTRRTRRMPLELEDAPEGSRRPSVDSPLSRPSLYHRHRNTAQQNRPTYGQKKNSGG